MALQTPPAPPNGVDRHAILRGKRLGFGGFGMGGTQALAACLHATPHPVGLPGRWTRAGTRSPGTGTWCFFKLPRELREPSERAERASEASEARAFCAFRLAVFKFGLTPEARRQRAPREKKIWISGPETARFQGRE